MQGDQILSVNKEDMRNATQEYAAAVLKVCRSLNREGLENSFYVTSFSWEYHIEYICETLLLQLCTSCVVNLEESKALANKRYFTVF